MYQPFQPLQAVLTPLTRSAIFLVATVRHDREAHAAVRAFCGDLPALVRTVGFRDLEGYLTCVMGIGSELWDRAFGLPRPALLHPMREVRGVHYAPSTPADLLFHIRAERTDLCFELAQLIMAGLRGSLSWVEEVQGFRYFDTRDLLGFVDGTENPQGALAEASVFVGDEDPGFAGGSYVTVQKYLHDLDAWNAVSVEEQERVIGRYKLSNVELPDDVKPSDAHNALTVIEQDGEELKIVRDNMPFGNSGRGEFGTYFIGYTRTPEVLEKMLDNMFIGDPPGNYDRILDFSTALTGSSFFAPAPDLLEELADRVPVATAAAGSLGIGSLKGEASV
ncbi:Dyp-type peroxidase [Nonomuraea sp. NPDC050310]|uniref:Dyp-type peroxidase n=1 Tax=unclassified Nonomuraea TaxID=2593643 RepID=UPI0033E02582